MGVGFSVLFPILTPVGRQLGLNEIQITSIISVSSLTVFLATPRWGRLSDRLGRKPIILIGLFGFSIGTFLFNVILELGLSAKLSGLNLFFALLLARICHASIMSAAMPAATAYMADITDIGSRTQGMGAAGAANNLGSIVGPALSGLAIIYLLLPLWLVGFLAFLNGLFALRFLPPSPRGREEKQKIVKLRYSDGRILPFIITGVALFTGFAIVQQTMGFKFQDSLALSTAETSAVFGSALVLSAITALVSQVFIVQRIKTEPIALIQIAMPILILAFILMAFSETRLPLTVAFGIMGLGMGLATPGLMAGASLAVPAENQGAVAGLAASCGPLGFTLGPLIGGAIYQFSPTATYLFAASIYFLLFVFLGKLEKSRRC